MEIACSFNYGSLFEFYPIYTCLVDSADINEPGTFISAFNGTHQNGESNKDVEAISFRRCNVKYFPRGLPWIFPNLRKLNLFRTGLQAINRADLIGFQDLESLCMVANKLKMLPSDLFHGMTKLKHIAFSGNQIEFMSSDILKPIMNNADMYIDFLLNKNFPAIPSTPTSTGVRKIIDEKCIKPTEDHDLCCTLKNSATVVDHLWESKKFVSSLLFKVCKNFPNTGNKRNENRE